MSSTRRGLILFAHGSRDPAWRQPIEAVAARIAARAPDLAVACAYLELDQPDLLAAAGQLVGQGVVSLAIVPMFLGVGRHAREDLPRLVNELQSSHPALQVHLRPAIGEHEAVLEFLAETALTLS